MPLEVDCQLLNPDTDGDGVRDVFLDDFMYWSATFVNISCYSLEYGARHIFYAMDSCPDPQAPVNSTRTQCKGTLEGYGVATHYYRARVPSGYYWPDFNPFAVEIAAWECNDGVPQYETGRCCFDVEIKPGWEPPPVAIPETGFDIGGVQESPPSRHRAFTPGRADGFEVEEIEGPPDFQR